MLMRAIQDQTLFNYEREGSGNKRTTLCDICKYTEDLSWRKYLKMMGKEENSRVFIQIVMFRNCPVIERQQRQGREWGKIA